MEIIKQAQLENGVGGTSISGIILVSNYNISLTKTNKEYIIGKLQSGKSIDFKAWGNSEAFEHLKNEEYTNVPSYITGKFDNYGGQLSIIVETCQAVEGYEPIDFYPVVYNTDAYWDAMKGLMKAKVSEKCLNLANKYLFENKEVADAFKIEFAASNHHDNVKSGLLAHTYKVLATLNFMQNTYPTLFEHDENSGINSSDFVDLIYFGALMHDIGKTREMHYGVYQKEAIVTHRYLGIEFINKDEIVEAYSEYWYYNLVSVFLQHHGEYDDDCRTSAAYIIHKADMFDSELTSLSQIISNDAFGKEDNKRIKVNNKYLTV